MVSFKETYLPGEPHDPRLVRHADRVIGMEDGMIRSDRRLHVRTEGVTA